MKKASEVMYRIGRIVAIILIPVFAIVSGIYLTLGIIDIIREGEEWTHLIGESVRYGIHCILCVVALIIISIFYKKMAEDQKDKVPHIVLIVFGVIGSNPFLILGGIFGLVAIAQDGEEKPAEEPKEEVQAEEKKEEE